MIIVQPLFYVLSFLLLLSSLLVFVSRNSVHSALCLIACFILSAALLVLMGADFLAFVILIAYIGAVAVFFLFVVMMLDLEKIDAGGWQPSVPTHTLGLGSIILLALIFLVELFGIASDKSGVLGVRAAGQMGQMASPQPSELRHIGNLLYTQYTYPFEAAGVVLFVAMIGAIVLTLNSQILPFEQNRTRRLKQDVRAQNITQKSAVLHVVSMKPGQGLLKLSQKAGDE